MMRKGRGGGDDPNMPIERAPLPVEAEEASAQLQYGQLTGVAIGVVFLAITAYMAYVIFTTPDFPYLVPSLAMAFFALGGVVDLSLAASSRAGAVRLWQDGKFVESSAFLKGWRRTLGFVPGGVLPGWFHQRALERIHPLVLLEQGGGAPSPVLMPTVASSSSGGPGPWGAPPSTPAPSVASSPGSDNVAPDPFGGRRAVAPSPSSSSGSSRADTSALWARSAGYAPPSASSTPPPPATPAAGRTCPSCQSPVDADSRFCKLCGASVPL